MRGSDIPPPPGYRPTPLATLGQQLVRLGQAMQNPNTKLGELTELVQACGVDPDLRHEQGEPVMKGATLHRLIDIYADSRRDLRVRLAALRMFVRAVCADRNTSFAEYRQGVGGSSRACRSPSRLERERAAYLDRTRAARQAMEESGAWLIGNSAMIEQALTFDDLCDLLG